MTNTLGSLNNTFETSDFTIEQHFISHTLKKKIVELNLIFSFFSNQRNDGRIEEWLIGLNKVHSHVTSLHVARLTYNYHVVIFSLILSHVNY